jgi:hypothetical protein
MQTTRETLPPVYPSQQDQDQHYQVQVLGSNVSMVIFMFQMQTISNGLPQ